MATQSWNQDPGLEEAQVRRFKELQEDVVWVHPVDRFKSLLFRISHGGEVAPDGHCLFAALKKAMGSDLSPIELRKKAVDRLLEDLVSMSQEEKDKIESAIKNMYLSDLNSGPGIHEIRLLASKESREDLDVEIDSYLQTDKMQRQSAAELVYKSRCFAIDNGPNWAKYMSICGSPDDKYDIITLRYAEKKLVGIDENRNGNGAAWGDDFVIDSLATEFKRDIIVVSLDENNCISLFRHRPKCEVIELPVFLSKRGLGGKHYEPLMAQRGKATVIGPPGNPNSY